MIDSSKVQTVKVTVTRTANYRVCADSKEEVQRIVEDAILHDLIDPDDDTEISVEMAPVGAAVEDDLVLYYCDEDFCAHFGRVIERTP